MVVACLIIFVKKEKGHSYEHPYNPYYSADKQLVLTGTQLRLQKYNNYFIKITNQKMFENFLMYYLLMEAISGISLS